jgi:Putative beta-barrel porin-2, OmpL-like. bbp2
MSRSVSALAVCFVSALSIAAQESPDNSQPLTDRERALLERIDELEQRVAALESKRESPDSQPRGSTQTGGAAAAPQASVATQPGSGESGLSFAGGTTLNFNLDGYYGYNFNHPLGRVNLLRANDVLSDNFTLNQVDMMVERAPDLSAGRRFGFRADLMFGENTETLQGSSLNEPRPQVYRNMFQAYGSYVFPIGTGLQIDFGKFSSSLGTEGNYTKDQLNYSRSYYFNFLPFYHMGVRANYNINSKLSAQYWLVNGANQTEDFNGFKSQAAILIAKPTSNATWNINYYEGQEQRDVVPDLNPGIPVLPTQPGLSVSPIQAPHNGREHIIDSYIALQMGPNWSATVEGDYVIDRVASNSSPAHAYGGAAYLHRQITNALALNGRFEYLADRGGLFSGVTQDLKEVTATAVYQFINGFQTRLEYRRDFSNRPFFLTNNPAILAGAQSTATLGMIWWFGGKQGIW